MQRAVTVSARGERPGGGPTPVTAGCLLRYSGPLVGILPVLLPIVTFLGIAGAIAIGRRLARGDLTMRAIVIVALGLLIGAIVWVKRNVLGTGYPSAHVLGTLAMIVSAGAAIRIMRRVTLAPAIGAAVAAIAAFPDQPQQFSRRASRRQRP